METKILLHPGSEPEHMWSVSTRQYNAAMKRISSDYFKERLYVRSDKSFVIRDHNGYTVGYETAKE